MPKGLVPCCFPQENDSDRWGRFADNTNAIPCVQLARPLIA